MTSIAFPAPTTIPTRSDWHPGREMDIKIAIELMGWTKYDNGAALGPDYLLPPDGSALHARGTVRKVPHFSTKIEPAWTVAEKLRTRGFHLIVHDFHDLPTIDPDHQWQVAFVRSELGGTSGAASARTFWLAICRAALRTI